MAFPSREQKETHNQYVDTSVNKVMYAAHIDWHENHR
jgi:hypothetical protein